MAKRAVPVPGKKNTSGDTPFGPNEKFIAELLVIGFTRPQAENLITQGLDDLETLGSLSAEQVATFSGCLPIKAIAILKKLNGDTGGTNPVAQATAVDPNAEIPEGSAPSASQVNGFANQLGIDSNTMNMIMMGNMMNGIGMGDMNIASLVPIPMVVAGYNPKVRNMYLMLIGQLEKAYGGPLIVINADGSVNRELTTKYITSLEEGFELAEDDTYYDEDGEPHSLIAAGVDAQSVYDADPLDKTRVLQQNGMGVGRINWSKVSLEVRQVVYCAVETGELSQDNPAQVQWLRDNIKPGVTRFILNKQAPKGAQLFNEKARNGELPTLKKSMSGRPARRSEIMPRRRAATSPFRNQNDL